MKGRRCRDAVSESEQDCRKLGREFPAISPGMEVRGLGEIPVLSDVIADDAATGRLRHW